MNIPNRVRSTHSQTLSRETPGPGGVPTMGGHPVPESPANERFEARQDIPTRQRLMHVVGVSAGTAVAVGLFHNYPVALAAVGVAGMTAVVGGMVGCLTGALADLGTTESIADSTLPFDMAKWGALVGGVAGVTSLALGLYP